MDLCEIRADEPHGLTWRYSAALTRGTTAERRYILLSHNGHWNGERDALQSALKVDIATKRRLAGPSRIEVASAG